MIKHLRWVDECTPRGVDERTGVAIRQLTSGPLLSHNIYGEQLHTSADGSRIALVRCASPDIYWDPLEVWVCDLNTWQTARAGLANRWCFASNPYCDTVYFPGVSAGSNRSETHLMRLDLLSLECEPVFAFGACPVPLHSGAISRDWRYFVSYQYLGGNRFGIYRVDLERGTWEMIHEQQDIVNPHLQFETAQSHDILVQHNRGCVLDADGEVQRLVGDEGATLYVIDRDGKNYRPLPVGKPYTAPVMGHECWIGDSGRILFSTCDPPPEGNLHTITPGDARSAVLARGHLYNHVSASADGHYFVADAWPTAGEDDGELYVGTIADGHTRLLCHPHTSNGHPQYSHAHPYITPNNRHVIFNSDRTGLAQVYAAVLPDGFLDSLREGLDSDNTESLTR